ncbi:importin subunit beta-3, partial [Linderina macrospora]
MSQFSQTAAQLQTLMGSLMSSDNAERTQAEAALTNDWVVAQPQVVVGSLAYLIHQAPDAQVRAFASVLLRRIAPQDAPGTDSKEDAYTVWSRVPADVRVSVKTELLGALRDETDRSARHKMCDTIADINKVEAQDEWPDLLPALYSCAQDGNLQLRESAYRIFAMSPFMLSTQPAEAVSSAFIGAFQDSDASVRLAALKAAVAYILSTDDKQRLSQAAMVPHMLSVLEPLLRDKDESNLVEALSALIEPAEESPKLFRSVLGNLITFSTEIGKNEEFENATRQTAIELLLTLAESSPGMCRKNVQFCQSIVP